MKTKNAKPAEIVVESMSHDDGFSSVMMTNGKQSVYIGRGRSGQINVCNLNASNRAWGGTGRYFATFDAAINAYKSPFMKAAIVMAQAYI